MVKVENKEKVKAVIFDMDGVIIDSALLWKRAEKEVFTAIGVRVTDELSSITENMTTVEVTKFWFNKHPWVIKSLNEVENEVIKRVTDLIEKEGRAVHGVEDVIRSLKMKGYKIGLATNSPASIIPVVLKKLQIERYFDAVSSAEHEEEGKPDPSVYLTVAGKMNVNPEHCVAIEDSVSGIMSAKRAGMNTILMTDENVDVEDGLVDYRIRAFSDIDLFFFS